MTKKINLQILPQVLMLMVSVLLAGSCNNPALRRSPAAIVLLQIRTALYKYLTAKHFQAGMEIPVFGGLTVAVL
jgi:hypothetical protein